MSIVKLNKKNLSYPYHDHFQPNIFFYLVSDKTCGCSCHTIEIVSEGATSKATEYEDGALVNIDQTNSLDPEHWEKMLLDSLNSTYSTKVIYDRRNISEHNSALIIGRLLGVDLQYQNYDLNRHNLTFWESYKKLMRSTNLRYKDLLGSYEFYECKEYEIFGRVSRFPVYRKTVDNGTEAFLYKNKFLKEWQVADNKRQ